MGRNTLKIYHHSESFLHSILGCNTHVGQIVDFGYNTTVLIDVFGLLIVLTNIKTKALQTKAL